MEGVIIWLMRLLILGAVGLLLVLVGGLGYYGFLEARFYYDALSADEDFADLYAAVAATNDDPVVARDNADGTMRWEDGQACYRGTARLTKSSTRPFEDLARDYIAFFNNNGFASERELDDHGVLFFTFRSDEAIVQLAQNTPPTEPPAPDAEPSASYTLTLDYVYPDWDGCD